MISVKDLVSIGTWNKRYKEMQELIHKGPEERKVIAEALFIMSATKDLSFG